MSLLDEYLDALGGFSDLKILRLPLKSQRNARVYMTAELLRQGGRKNATNLKRDLLAIYFDGDDTKPGAHICAKLSERKGQGLTKAEREAGDETLTLIRANPIAAVAQVNKRFALAQSKKPDCESSANERIRDDSG